MQLRFEAANSQESDTCAHERASKFAWLEQKVIVGQRLIINKNKNTEGC